MERWDVRAAGASVGGGGCWMWPRPRGGRRPTVPVLDAKSGGAAVVASQPASHPTLPPAITTGWKRMALLVLYFGPSNLLEPEVRAWCLRPPCLLMGSVAASARILPQPCTTRSMHTPYVQASFDAVSNRLIVGPVVETLVYNKVPRTVGAMPFLV